ncbi:MAG: hypothetical protein QOH66_2582 [Actinomycetota bacterium]|jgi:hypothetical protein|nr:hypothetical protein [Actinomycetota bacterium]
MSSSSSIGFSTSVPGECSTWLQAATAPCSSPSMSTPSHPHHVVAFLSPAQGGCVEPRPNILLHALRKATARAEAGGPASPGGSGLVWLSPLWTTPSHLLIPSSSWALLSGRFPVRARETMAVSSVPGDGSRQIGYRCRRSLKFGRGSSLRRRGKSAPCRGRSRSLHRQSWAAGAGRVTDCHS